MSRYRHEMPDDHAAKTDCEVYHPVKYWHDPAGDTVWTDASTAVDDYRFRFCEQGRSAVKVDFCRSHQVYQFFSFWSNHTTACFSGMALQHGLDMNEVFHFHIYYIIGCFEKSTSIIRTPLLSQMIRTPYNSSINWLIGFFVAGGFCDFF